MSPPSDRLARLNALLPSQFEELIFRLGVPHHHLSAPSAPQATRAVELLRYLDQTGRVDELDRLLAPRPAPSPPPRSDGGAADHAGRPARVFISYAHEDESHRDSLVKHLTPLRRAGLVEIWHDREILPGASWADVIDESLVEADLVLLLVSTDFVNSDYCFEKELKTALLRHKQRLTRVIPIIIRPVDLSLVPFAHLQGLPRDAKPVSTWANKDEAWLDVVKGIRRVVDELRRIPRP